MKTITMKKSLDTSEPMHCERRGCDEELNGLMHCSLNFGKGYVLGLWLCRDCSKDFKIKKVHL